MSAIILDESNWLPVSIGLALLCVSILLYRRRRSDVPGRRRVAAAMNLFFGAMIATMAFGHLAGVTTKLALGTLKGSPVALYAIGIVLTVPAGWLVHHSRRLLDAPEGQRRTTLVLNSWLAATLMALGLHNLPLAAAAFFNIGHQLHSRRVAGWAIAGLAAVFNVALFVASLVFLASGQSFEQFRGLE